MFAGGIYAPGELPGFKQHCLTAALIKEFEKEVEETDMQWLKDVLIEAKIIFGHEDHHLLPKTGKRRRRKKSSKSTIGIASTSESLFAKWSKANINLDAPPSKVTVSSSALLPAESSSDAPEDVEPQRGGGATTARCESHPVAVDKNPPVRRSNRKRCGNAKNTKWKILESTSSDESEKSIRPSQSKRAKPKVHQDEKVDVATSKPESGNVIDPPPRNSPRQEIESYYKDRVKRLINHHEKLMTKPTDSEEDFTPQKQNVVVKCAQKKRRTARASSTRSTCGRKTKPVRDAAKRKNEASKDEAETVEEIPIGHKVVDDAKTSADQKTISGMNEEGWETETGTSIAKLPLAGTPGKNERENTEGNDDDASNATQKISTPKAVTASSSGGLVHRVFGITSTPQKPPRAIPGTTLPLGTSTRPSRSKIVKPIRGDGGSETTKESQPEQVETKAENSESKHEVSYPGPAKSEDEGKPEAEEEVRDEGEMTTKPLDDEKSSGGDETINNQKDPADQRSNTGEVSNTDEVSKSSSKFNAGEVDNVESTGNGDEDDDDVVPPSPKSTTSEKPESSSSADDYGQRVLRKSCRRKRSSIIQSCSKRRSSNYQRFKTRQSKRLSATTSEETHEDERRLTRSRDKISEEPPQKSDDGSCPGRSTPPTDGKKSPEEGLTYDRMMNPHMKLLLNPVFSASKTNTPHSYKTGQVASFIKRNTPINKTQRDRKQEIVEKQRREEEVRRKQGDERKERMVALKRQRDERTRNAAEARARKLQEQSEKKRKREEKQEQSLVLSNKQREEKRKEELERRLKSTQKKVQAVERRRQEEEFRLQKRREQEEVKKRQEEFIQRRKEHEEQERNKKLEECRRLVEQRRLEAERHREELELKKERQNIAHEREMQERKDEREREQKEWEKKRLAEAEQREQERKRLADAERREQEKREKDAAEAERLKAAQRALREKDREEEQKHLNEVMKKAKEDATKKANTSTTSYDMTPQRIYVADSEENYGIEDLNSGDSTDDEENPRKVIPSWAQGAILRDLCVKQYMKPPDLNKLFPAIDAPDLSILFAKKRARFFKRTSSAVWNSPPNALYHRR